ncbi:hypothetical protein SAY86_015798 [Trapa natans]|uniref:Uncharacterized protein n=1 Tax=Trapa natans TaxID=22666 RepID=A0AAN7QYV7_TRANT|nr:hypothetical protein SAY86_015798 [Trapa natans]
MALALKIWPVKESPRIQNLNFFLVLSQNVQVSGPMKGVPFPPSQHTQWSHSCPKSISGQKYRPRDEDMMERGRKFLPQASPWSPPCSPILAISTHLGHAQPGSDFTLS